MNTIYNNNNARTLQRICTQTDLMGFVGVSEMIDVSLTQKGLREVVLHENSILWKMIWHKVSNYHPVFKSFPPSDCKSQAMKVMDEIRDEARFKENFMGVPAIEAFLEDDQNNPAMRLLVASAAQYVAQKTGNKEEIEATDEEYAICLRESYQYDEYVDMVKIAIGK